MGSLGSPNQSSNTTSTVNNNNEQLAASDGGSLNIFNATGGSTITTSDPEVLKALGLGAFGLVNDIIGGQAAEQTKREEFQSTVWEQAQAAQAGQLAAITDLGKTTATGGQSDFNKTILYLGVAIVLAVAAIFIWRR